MWCGLDERDVSGFRVNAHITMSIRCLEVGRGCFSVSCDLVTGGITDGPGIDDSPPRY